MTACGAIKELDKKHGEIKSMCTAISYQRKGLATKLLRHILEEAERRLYHRVSLETGSMSAFKPAQNLYTRFGFHQCEPFASYVKDPYSICMSKILECPAAHIE